MAANHGRRGTEFRELAAFLALRESGAGRVKIARELKRPTATIQNWIQAADEGRLRRVEGGIQYGDVFYESPFTKQATGGTPSVSKAPERAPSIREAAHDMRKSVETRSAPPQTSWPLRGPGDFEVRMPGGVERPQRPTGIELWKAAEDINARNIAVVKSQSLGEVDFGPGPVALTFVSDQHIEPNGLCDLRRMRADAELIRDTPGVFCMLGGDGVNNHIKHRAAILLTQSTPDDAWMLYDHYLDLLEPKIVAAISGNHDLWTHEAAGVDMVRRLAESRRLFYAPNHVYITVKVGGQQYVVAMRHQYRYGSSFNMGHTIHRWYDMGDQPFDVGVVCHEHEAWVGTFKRHGRNVWGARPGSYQVTSGYAGQYGFNDSDPTCPTFIFYGDHRRVVGFDDLRTAVKVLTK